MSSSQLVDTISANMSRLSSPLSPLLNTNYSSMDMSQKYEFIMTELRDPRVDDWMLMSSPWPTVGLCAAYYVFVRFIGPAFMKGKPSFDVQKLMFAYNFLQTLFSLWIFTRLSQFWLTGKNRVDQSALSFHNIEQSQLSICRQV